MASYASVISLKHTIKSLLHASLIAISPFTLQILEFAYNETKSLQEVLERSNDGARSRTSWERLDGLEGKIRDCANKLEDVLEFHELNSEDEKVLLQDITSFGERVKKMEKEYIEELSREEDDNDNDDDVTPFWSKNDFGVEMVGHSDLFYSTRGGLLRPVRPDDMMRIALLGEEGSGRSMVVRTIFEDARNSMCSQIFDCTAWVTIGTTLTAKQVVIRIISQLTNLSEADCPNDYADDELCKGLWYMLYDRRYMIVLADVDDVELVKYLLERSFPEQSNGSVVFVITNSMEVAEMATESVTMHTGYFSEIMSLALHRLFYNNMSHYQRELIMVAGKKIVDNCRCSFISFTKAVLFLWKSEATLEHWNELAADKENPIFVILDEISEVSKIQTEFQHYYGGLLEEMSLWIAHPNKVEYIQNVLMFPKRFFLRMQIRSFYGMPGIGKTIFARKIFKDESIYSHFDHRVWITLGPKYQSSGILIDILAQIYADIDKFLMKGDEELVRKLCEQLLSKRCLIVFDDLHSKEPLLQLKKLFPDIKGTALVTSRLVRVAKFERDDTHFEMMLLDKEESWCLLRQKVFGGGLCPSKFEKAGRKIAERCDGLPLLIVTIAEQLLKAEISEEYWNHVASDKEKSVFEIAHHQISMELLPSYQILPQHLKQCLLYIGVFREQYKIPISELINLSIAEGFLEPNPSQMEEDFVAECVSELLDKSLVMVEHKVSDYQIKTCRLHSIFWHLSKDRVEKNKFFHAMNIYNDCSIESMESPRRFCIRNSILLGMKEVQSSMASNTSTTHSFLCVGPFQQYPVSFTFDFRLLRVMNAVTIRLYMFPSEILGLFHLIFLGITCNGLIPSSISNLRKLQFLIVKRYMNSKAHENSFLLPVEIWDMKELRHLQIMGGCLPNPKCGNAGLVKLSTLLDVRAESCREEVLKGMPNLKRLGIRIELEPDDDGKKFTYLNNIHHLDRLESLKCVVVNPRIRSAFLSPPAPVSMFPPSLKKLSLSGLGYSWQHMIIIGKLENLEVLKLKCYAFQGPEWEMEDNIQFQKLEYLSIEDSDIVRWRDKLQVGNELHRRNRYRVSMGLKHLCMKHCYKLKELPTANRVFRLTKIEIIDCSPSTETWAEQLAEKFKACEGYFHRSWIANTR